MTTFGECGGCPASAAAYSPGGPSNHVAGTADIVASSFEHRLGDPDLGPGYELVNEYRLTLDFLTAEFARPGWWLVGLVMGFDLAAERPANVTGAVYLTDSDGSNQQLLLTLTRTGDFMFYPDPANNVHFTFNEEDGSWALTGNRVVYPRDGLVTNLTNNVFYIDRLSYRFRVVFQCSDWVAMHTSNATMNQYILC